MSGGNNTDANNNNNLEKIEPPLPLSWLSLIYHDELTTDDAVNIFYEIRSKEENNDMLDALRLVTPLCKMPYFHGRLSVAEASKRLEEPGQYLIFLDIDNDSRPTLLVVAPDESISYVPIMQTHKGLYKLNNDDLEYKFITVDQLIRYHSFRPDAFVNYCGNKLNFRQCVTEPNWGEELLVEHDSVMQNWSYYVSMEKDFGTVKSYLKINGDYVVSGDLEDQYNCHSYVLWNEKIVTVHFSMHPIYKRWMLPRMSKYEPEETVENVDVLIKSISRMRCIINGVRFLRPATARVEFEHEPEIPGLISQNVPMPPRKKAPKPINGLSYFYGEAEAAEMEKYIRKIGQFLLYIDRNTKILFLAVNCSICEEGKPFHERILFNTNGYFYFPRAMNAGFFPTVQELIEANDERYIDFKDEATGKLQYRAKLLQCVPNLQSISYLPVFEKNDLESMRCYHGNIAENDACKLLLQSGDFLMRHCCERNHTVITVRWQRNFYDLLLRTDKTILGGVYKLPRSSVYEPIECVEKVTDFLRSAVFNEFQFHGVILQRDAKTFEVGVATFTKPSFLNGMR